MPKKETTSIDSLYPPKKSGKVRIIVVIAFVAILVVSATAATTLYSVYSLPDPATTDTDGLIRWLVTVDLTEHPEETHRILARRLEEEFGGSMNEKLDGSIDCDEIDSQLTDEYRARLWCNVQILFRPWFFSKMECYYAATPSEQNKILDQLLDQTKAWKWILELAPPGEIDPNKPGIHFVFFMHKIQEWKQTCSPAGAERLNQFVSAIQTRFLLRKFFNAGASAP